MTLFWAYFLAFFVAMLPVQDFILGIHRYVVTLTSQMETQDTPLFMSMTPFLTLLILVLTFFQGIVVLYLFDDVISLSPFFLAFFATLCLLLHSVSPLLSFSARSPLLILWGMSFYINPVFALILALSMAVCTLISRSFHLGLLMASLSGFFWISYLGLPTLWYWVNGGMTLIILSHYHVYFFKCLEGRPETLLQTFDYR